MGYSIKRLTLFLMVLSAFSALPSAYGGCGGSCAVSGGSSYNFMGDPAFNIGMSSYDEFVRDNIGQTSLSTKSPSPDDPSSTNSSLSQTSNNSSQTDFVVSPIISPPDNGTVRLGASGTQDTRVSTLVFATFNSKF
jgi:hypothetical protein